MIKEIVIMVAAWLLMISTLIAFVPKEKIRHAQVVFLFQQFVTWVLGLIVVEMRFIEYPARLFSYANRTSFSFEYFIYPSICVIFNLHYPKDNSKKKQFLYFFCYCTGMTIFEVLCEIYTDLIEYTNWTWYYSWITFYLTLYLSRKYYIWFFKRKSELTGN
ncbi:hypothetical protein Cpap_2917 [Ruminiclostridium papyrosolvens DSM 2782]|uniref:Uncharacterized protein n=1 Tax=Ruminiclostridium papyrosolvens DSM 2782 TaxID=588581 RepID=F1TAF2_9FIRM|nr:CBO0543 family protein [Ruminiclostridium papyrosolvens]EGD48495.1 hypothetical protein Cpap_2917 [Ruminiclostridium papyrosolvens DSM 2782]WES32747.1 hypothetical protein P0092_13370 [Ruminiclostridium papyrosolvens DSM 2782]